MVLSPKRLAKKMLGVAAIAVMAGAGSASAATQSATGTLASPPGITIQVLGKGQGYDLGKQSAAALPRDELAFSDSKGLTLYTYDKDPLGKATCVDECAKIWIPAAVPAKAKPFGEWTVVSRTDGVKQWAYRGKALYHFIKDVDPASTWGNSPARFGARRKNGAGEYVGGGVRGSGVKDAAPDQPAQDGWKIALAYPVGNFATPAGLVVKEVPDAAALALVDYRNHTLYAFDGDAAKDAKACASPCVWQPAAAAQLAEPAGDFSLIQRPDGIKQWAYKGKGLYSYVGDLAPGDANGIGVDKKWNVSAVSSFFMPVGVAITNTPGQGRILTTDNGMTIYKRDGHINQSGGGHSLRRGQPARPAVGRDIGAEARCEVDCDKWHPLKASADAQPQGFWTIYTRADGSRQWGYQGYALYTYDGDKKPGDMSGNDDYDFAFSTDAAPKTMIDVGTPMDGAMALYWSIVVP
ncbi:MAG: hypothetical protein ACYCZX_13975 [Rhodospirillaceae bacterium]